MLTYNQRYRPRTTREYTKSDLTVYDSAGNTALNTLKVYGKSEIVDGTIKSAGEGWATIDLGTLNWGYSSSYQTPFFSALLSTIGAVPDSIDFICPNYTPKAYFWETSNNDMCMASSGSHLNISNSNYTDATDFKTAMSGVLLCYELADPTQGNTIAIKADNGTGIDGTMATFTTGTPLRGIPETNVRDVMEWDGTSREVTKKCVSVDLGTLNWGNASEGDNCFYNNLSNTDGYHKATLMAKYTQVNTVQELTTIDKTYCRTTGAFIVIHDTDYTDATAFKTAMNGVMLLYELATPTSEALTQTENTSIASLRTFDGTTHFTNNASTDMTVNYTIRVPTIS